MTSTRGFRRPTGPSSTRTNGGGTRSVTTSSNRGSCRYWGTVSRLPASSWMTRAVSTRNTPRCQQSAPNGWRFSSSKWPVPRGGAASVPSWCTLWRSGTRPATLRVQRGSRRFLDGAGRGAVRPTRRISPAAVHPACAEPSFRLARRVLPPLRRMRSKRWCWTQPGTAAAATFVRNPEPTNADALNTTHFSDSPCIRTASFRLASRIRDQTPGMA